MNVKFKNTNVFGGTFAMMIEAGPPPMDPPASLAGGVTSLPQAGSTLPGGPRAFPRPSDRTPRSPVRLALALVVVALVLAPAAGAAECAGDECQPPATQPADPVPGTAVAVGPGNPPVRFPQSASRKKKKKPQQRRRGDQRQRGER